jgi:hypothetical protein
VTASGFEFATYQFTGTGASGVTINWIATTII